MRSSWPSVRLKKTRLKSGLDELHAYLQEQAAKVKLWAN